MRTLEDRLASVEAWQTKHAREHDAFENRVRDGVQHEFAQATDALKAHVSNAMKPVERLAGDMAKVLEMNAAQTAMLEDAREERLRRKILDEQKALAHAEADRLRMERKSDAEVNLMRADARAKRWQAVAFIIGPIVAILVALITASYASHH